MNNEGRHLIRPFSSDLRRESFRSGEDALDSWLREYSGQSERKHATRTYCAISEGHQEIVGYYSLVVAVVSAEEADNVFGESAKYSIPGILLARLAVSRDRHGDGIGRALLKDALETCIAVSRRVGVQVILVDALHGEAASFYTHHGFTAFRENRLRLFLPIATALAAEAG
jgi:Predicted acetyltransferase